MDKREKRVGKRCARSEAIGQNLGQNEVKYNLKCYYSRCIHSS